MDHIEWDYFKKVDIRVGTIIEANEFPEARKPAYKLLIDFGDEIGIKRSSAQITDLYGLEDLLNKQIIAVINFPPKQIGHFISECLITGFHRQDGKVVLAIPDTNIPNGSLLS